jgi:hypothetical protein
MSNVRYYLGASFEVWDGQQAWFWLVIDPHRARGAIGTAASETEAVRDACLSIDEVMSVRDEHLGGWGGSLDRLDQYLNAAER